MDRIGQLLFTSYPQLGHSPGLDALVLRPFAPGVLLHSDGRHHRAGGPAGGGGARSALHAVRAFASAPRPPAALPKVRARVRALRPVPPAAAYGAPDALAPEERFAAELPFDAGPPPERAVPGDRAQPFGIGTPLRLRAALSRIATTPVERLLARPELPRRSGRWRPAGCPPAPSRVFWGAFVGPLFVQSGTSPLPAVGGNLALRGLRERAAGVWPEGRGRTCCRNLLRRPRLPGGTGHNGGRGHLRVATNAVTTAEHGVIRCRAVLVATGARSAAELLPGLRVPDFHPVTVVHHTTDEPPATGGHLLLDSERGGPVAHTAVISAVDPSRAPAGRALVSSTVLGPDRADVDDAVRRHLARLYGVSTARWETLAVHHTAEAVPAMRPPHDLRRPVRLLAGLYVCGDHRDTSTLQGALHSARRAAAAILGDLGTGRPMHTSDPVPTTSRAAAA
ncbi:oxidoreductase [Streptomyces sp. e14]|nr:oxidoreductase [Streptomyces sp. e14]